MSQYCKIKYVYKPVKFVYLPVVETDNILPLLLKYYNMMLTYNIMHSSQNKSVYQNMNSKHTTIFLC